MSSRYRFRLVNMACDPNYQFSIDGHNMTVIEVDGVNHNKTTVDQIDIYAGENQKKVISGILTFTT